MKAYYSAAFWGALCPLPAIAASASEPVLSLLWVLPFAGILASIALFPMFLESLWHRSMGTIIAVWTGLFLVPYVMCFGMTATLEVVSHALLAEYLPFILLLLTLYTVSGGVWICGNLHGSPMTNTTLLAIGTVLASFMGTTGAAMLLIRPLLRANDNRRHRVHVVIFFIFLVANIGGGLTPLGDPPLFLGFLQGVTFAWTFRQMVWPVALAAVCLLVLFYALDSYWYRKEGVMERDPTPDSPLRIQGKRNILLLVATIGAVLLSGFWQPGNAFSVMGYTMAWQNIVRDGLLLLITLLSLWITPRAVRQGNQFCWGPMREVAVLFIGLFITITPMIALLRLGHHGPLGSMLSFVNDSQGRPVDAMYFWLTGLLSSFLDNAPTYLVFFNLAAGEASRLMGPMSSTLLAISMGAVFMGANTYIGNAPNFMIKAIAQERGVAMPSFFGYMLWSIGILIPLFVLMTWLLF